VPFSSPDYRTAVRQLVERRKAIDRSASYARLAAETGIQATYVSNVLAGRAHFGTDQLFLVGRWLRLSEAGQRFLTLLMEHERCSVPERKLLLERELETLRRENQQTKNHLRARAAEPTELEAAEYYLDPTVTIVHVCLRVPRYAKTPTLLCTDLAITAEHLVRVLSVLEHLGYVERSPKGVWKVVRGGYHLPDSSPLCIPHQAQLRVKSIGQMYRVVPGERHHVSVTFSGDAATKRSVHAEFLSFLQRAESVVRNAPDVSVYQMNFDLFPWLSSAD